ncbi:unnamed protein product [Symbiodinium natans]|uniref:Uncharacterized protein n=1 Tax=Symbiodinium natans TaxID=878477 RepID=A0A812S2C1_9DINO|nr:unnamed protein product [Symbiodinium natans]
MLAERLHRVRGQKKNSPKTEGAVSKRSTCLIGGRHAMVVWLRECRRRNKTYNGNFAYCHEPPQTEGNPICASQPPISASQPVCWKFCGIRLAWLSFSEFLSS